MLHLLRVVALVVLVGGFAACADSSPKTASNSRKHYSALNETTGSHIRHPYSEGDDAPVTTGVSAGGGVGERPFASSSAGQFNGANTR